MMQLAEILKHNWVYSSVKCHTKNRHYPRHYHHMLHPNEVFYMKHVNITGCVCQTLTWCYCLCPVVIMICFFVPLSVGSASRRCLLDANGVAYWGPPSFARCVSLEYRYLHLSVSTWMWVTCCDVTKCGKRRLWILICLCTLLNTIFNVLTNLSLNQLCIRVLWCFHTYSIINGCK